MAFSKEIQEKILAMLDSQRGYNFIVKALGDFSDLGIFLAGGAVRDVVLNRFNNIKDLDFFFEGQDMDLALDYLGNHGTFSRSIFGTPRWHPSGAENIHFELIPINRFSNGLWRCKDIVDVLNQFDFTGNALALDLRTGQFFDPQNGYRDLVLGSLRAVRFDLPEEPVISGRLLSWRALLWFRLLHYAYTLDLSIDPLTAGWLKKNRGYYEQINEFNELFTPFRPEALDLLGIGE